MKVAWWLATFTFCTMQSLHYENLQGKHKYSILTKRKSLCVAQGLKSRFHSSAFSPEGKCKEYSLNLTCPDLTVCHSLNMFLSSSWRWSSATIWNWTILFVSKEVDLSIVAASIDRSPHTTALMWIAGFGVSVLQRKVPNVLSEDNEFILTCNQFKL